MKTIMEFIHLLPIRIEMIGKAFAED